MLNLVAGGASWIASVLLSLLEKTKCVSIFANERDQVNMPL